MIATVSIILLLVGCRSEPAGDWQLTLEDPQLAYNDEGVDLAAGIRLRPSPAMVEALERGVTLTLLVAMRASSGDLWIPGLGERRRHRLQISYLPLSRHYQLVDLHNDEQSTYPRFHMLQSALAEPRTWDFPLDNRANARRVRARIELDRTRLPSPMRLPTWFDPQWRLKSDWYELSAPEDLPDDP